MKVILVAAICTLGLMQAAPSEGATASVSPPIQGESTLHYVADPGEANDVFIGFSPDFSAVDVRDSGATISAGVGCTSVSAHKVRCDITDEDRVNASLGDGNDILAISSFFDSGGGRLSGGAGDDTIRGNDVAGTFERLLGGPGDDALFGRGGTDFLDGGPGADDLSGGSSCEGLTAGICAVDFDTVSYAGRTKRVRATANGRAADDGHGREGDTIMPDVERLIGGQGNDLLGGTTTNIGFADLIPHLVGMVLIGRAGSDNLRGGRAPDFLQGGKGDDILHGGARRDRLDGEAGNDRLVGDSGRDRIRGAQGRDELLAKDGQTDGVNGGRGTDTARVDPGLDRVQKVETIL